VERIRLDQHTVKNELAEQLFEHRPLMVFAGGVASLADRRTQSGRIQRDLGNECGAPAGRGLDRTPQGFAVTHQLIEISCTTGGLSDRPVADRNAECPVSTT